ncbi:MAG: hypothetical protein CME66_13125 [Halobacteriovoraceae bacterium]|jgi:hypothetical protein|nr:hypothetical protein [Halobacteriovoraceae bacterium]
MKKLGLILGLFLTTLLYAQTSSQGIIKAKLQTIRIKKPANHFVLKLETEMYSKRDDRNDIQGNESYFLIEPGYKFSSKFTARIGASYKSREMGGTKKNKESDNRDHFETSFIKLLYKPTKFKTNKIADVRLQIRFYSDQDDFFKRRYGSDGNYQLRAYFGRPLFGNFYLNKYTTYLRYKNYFNNEYVGNYSRDYELRARLSPTYAIDKGFDFGTTFTYNHIFKVRQINDEEEVDFDISLRKQFGPYAILGRIGFPIMSNNGGETNLQNNPDAGKQFSYALNLAAYL